MGVHQSVRRGFLLKLKTTNKNAFLVRSSKMTTQKNPTEKLRVNIVLNNKEAPMPDTTNCGVRSQFVFPRFQFFVLNLFLLFGFQVFSFHLGMRT